MFDVDVWLVKNGFNQLTDLFRDNEIDAEVLLELTNEDLKEMGLSLGRRKKLLKAITETVDATNIKDDTSFGNPEISGRRRQVTILFADLAGYTQLSSKLDPEEMHNLLNAYFTAVDQIIEEQGGTVDKHIGDGVMAVFGAPVAHSDDPLRALRASSNIHGAMSLLSEKTGRDLKAHIGIASGVVVASQTGSERHVEYTVTGDSVNLASRLDNLAKPGQTLVSESVYLNLKQYADFADKGSTSMKGLETPVAVWEFRQLHKEVEIHWQTELIGRSSEINLFQTLVEDVVAQISGQALLVRGEPGIGKTRLTAEYIKLGRQFGLDVHLTGFVDFGADKGLRTVRDLTTSLLGLSTSVPSEQREEACVRAIKQSLIDPNDEIFLRELLDLKKSDHFMNVFQSMEDRARKEGISRCLSTLVKKLASGRGVLLVIEDIHWSDPQSLEILASLARELPQFSAVMILTARIQDTILHQRWIDNLRGCPLTTIELQPLRQGDAIRIARNLPHSNRLDLDALVKRADGNPLFLEQLVSGALISGNDNLPDSVQGLVLARADSLPKVDREALLAASSLGQKFSLNLLRQLIGNPSYSGELLAQQRLLNIQGNECTFSHALIREGLYASMLSEQRRNLHGQAATLYSDLDHVLYAQHLDLAGSHEAPKAYLAAAYSEAERIHYDSAAALLHRALDLNPGNSMHELYMLLGELKRKLGKIAEAIDAHRLALKNGISGKKKCQALIGIAESLRINEAYSELLDTLNQASDEIGKLDLPKESSRICQLKGSVHFVHGETEKCISENERSLEYAKAAKSNELHAQAIGNLADAEFSRGRIKTANKLFDDCVTFAAKHQLDNVVAANLSMRGQAFLYMGQPKAALADCKEALELSKRQVNPRAELVARLVGIYALELFDAETGTFWAKAGLELAERLGAHRFENVCREYLGRYAAILGDENRAEKLISRVVTDFRKSESSMRFLGGRALGSYALVCRDASKRKDLLKEGEKILQLGLSAHNVLWFYRDAIEVSMDLGDLKEVARFADCLEEYTKSEPLLWSKYFVSRARALSSFAGGARSRARLDKAKEMGSSIGFSYSLARIESALG